MHQGRDRQVRGAWSAAPRRGARETIAWTRLGGVRLASILPFVRLGRFASLAGLAQLAQLARLFRLAWLVTAVAVATGCSANPPSIGASPGQWVDRNGQPVSEQQAWQTIRSADVLLLGEVHDSRDVHRRQVDLLERIDGPVVLGMEQLDLGEPSPALHSNSSADDARERAKLAGFDPDAWGWDAYRGLFELAFQKDWPLWPLNLPRRQAFAVGTAAADAWGEPLSSDQRAAIERLGAPPQLPADPQADLVNVLVASHCGRLDRRAARGIARAQVARDMLMADALVRAVAAYPDHRVVGVMGNQHARRDRGVGYWLQRPEVRGVGTVVSIGLLPSDTIQSLTEEARAYDLVRITAPVDREEPCRTGS
ncbi:MAG: ChaN family lipoprotein [Halothiobacillaceae bacterium]|nr:ChaN family lipoprotein [Halothiobacillaceae bacterium]